MQSPGPTFYPAPPGTQVRSLPFKKGFSATVAQKAGESTLPLESTWELVVKGPGMRAQRVRRLNDFRGTLQIATKEEALRFCRTWTDGQLGRYFDPGAFEVRFDRHKGPDGFCGIVHRAAWKSMIEDYPKVATYAGGFVVKRLLVVADSQRTKYGFESRCYESVERIGADGKFSVSLKEFKAHSAFDHVNWYGLNLE